MKNLFDQIEELYEIDRIKELSKYDRLNKLNQIEKLEKLQRLQKLEKLGKLEKQKKIEEKYKSSSKFFFKDLYPSYTEMVADIIMYVVLVCNILTILFFTIIKDIEGEIVKEQINNLLDDIFSDITINNIENDKKNNNKPDIKNTNEQNQINLIIQKMEILKNNFNKKLTSKINNIQPDKETEKKIKKNNEEIFKKSLNVLLYINLFCIFLLFALVIYNRYDFVYYLKKNIILGIFVIITELLFLYIISKKYVYIDKKYVIMETMKKILK